MDHTNRAPDSATQVLTVTVNPALDVSMTIDHLVSDKKIRAHDCQREAGGGGVNVSRVLRRLKVPSNSFVVVGGPIGSELLERMLGEGLDVTEFRIAGSTRESVAITEAHTGRQYRISVLGPRVDNHELLRSRIIEEAGSAQIVVLSGSLPPGVPTDFFAQICAQLAPDTMTIVDSAGAALAAAAAGSATIVKPSQRELAELVGWEPITAADIERAAREVLDLGGVGAVVASRGPSGALVAAREQAPIWFRPPPVRPVSTVGAGDSMVAGIAASLARGHDLIDATRLGVAAGTATVLTPGTELCTPTDVALFLDEVIVTERPVTSPSASAT